MYTNLYINWTQIFNFTYLMYIIFQGIVVIVYSNYINLKTNYFKQNNTRYCILFLLSVIDINTVPKNIFEFNESIY